MKQRSRQPLTPERLPACQAGDHPGAESNPAVYRDSTVKRTAELFRAMSDGPRLRVLEMLSRGERCVTEIVQARGENFSTVSQRLRVLRDQGLVVRRRKGLHVFYALADRHVADLIHNALAHAAELEAAPAPQDKEGD